MIRAKDALSELIEYDKFEKLDTDEKINRLYRAVHISLRLLLDVRLNQVKLSEGKKLSEFKKDVRKPGNPVIKDTDNIKVKK